MHERILEELSAEYNIVVPLYERIPNKETISKKNIYQILKKETVVGVSSIEAIVRVVSETPNISFDNFSKEFNSRVIAYVKYKDIEENSKSSKILKEIAKKICISDAYARFFAKCFLFKMIHISGLRELDIGTLRRLTETKPPYMEVNVEVKAPEVKITKNVDIIDGALPKPIAPNNTDAENKCYDNDCFEKRYTLPKSKLELFFDKIISFFK